MKALAFLSLLVFASLGLCQEHPPTKDILVSQPIFMVFMPEVKKELAIESAQEQKIKDAFGDSLQVEGDRVMLMMTGEEDFPAMQKTALKALNPGQAKRLREIWLQAMEGVGLCDDEVAKEMKLTEDQKRAISKITDEVGNKIIDLMHDGMIDETGAAKIKALRKEAGTRMLKTLDEDQTKAYDLLKGKEFKFKKKD